MPESACIERIVMAGGAAIGSLAFDEYGRPFLILRDQANQNRLTGKDAIKVDILGRITHMHSCVLISPLRWIVNKTIALYVGL